MKLTKILPAAAVLLLARGLSAQQHSTQHSELRQTVNAIAAAHKGSLALYAEDIKTGETVSIDPDQEAPTASVIKLPILFEALEQVRAHTVSFDDTLVLKKEDQVGGSGVLQFFHTPMQLTLKDVLTLMIAMSDNTATNLAIDRLGLKNIDARIRWMGLKNTWLYKKVMRPAPAGLPSDQQKFGLGKTTAREMAAVMKRIYQCELSAHGEPPQAGDLELCTTAMGMLRKQFYRDAIPRYIEGMDTSESGSAIGNKTGSLNKVRNDVALIASARGPIIISAFTYDNDDHSWTADNEAELTIAKLARAIVQAWSPEGLSPRDYKPSPPERASGSEHFSR